MKVCVENGYNEDPETLRRAREGINAFFIATQLIDENIVRINQRHFVVIHLHKPTEDMVLPDGPKRDFEVHPVGTLLGIEGEGREIRTTEPDITTLFLRGKRAPAGSEAYLLAKQETMPQPPAA